MRRASLVFVLAALSSWSVDARAESMSWAGFAAAFPAFPCQDGWMACLAGGGAVTPDLVNGEMAGQRVGWFDLQPTASFSPFVEFSKYDKVGSAAVASVEPEAVVPPEPSIDDAYADVEDTPETRKAKEEAQQADQKAAEARASQEQAKQQATEAKAEKERLDQEARRQREAEAAARKAADDAAQRASEAAANAQDAQKAQLQKEAAEAKRKADELARQSKAAEAAAIASAKAEEAAQRKAAEEEKKRQAAEAARATADAGARAKLESERARQDEERRKKEAAERAAIEEQKRADEEKARQEAQNSVDAAKTAALAAATEAAKLQKQREAQEASRLAMEAKAAQSADAEARAAAAAAAVKMKAEEQRLATEQAAAERRQKEEQAKQEAARLKAEQEAKAAEERRVAAEKADADRKAAEAKKAEEQRLAALAAAERAKAVAVVPVNPQPGTSDTTPPPSGGDGTCNLLSLEATATLGKLGPDEISSCETALAGAAKMTDKKKYSLLLQNNAWSKGDKAEWEKLVKRHLEEIDESDPDMAYKYALHLGKLGPGRASGAIKYAEVALENRSRWSGDTYTSRVNSLYKVRVVAAQSMWKAAEEAHTAAPTDETRKKADERRNMTKVYAREWYEYAKSVGRDTSDALQVCTSAAGTASYCEN